MDDFARRDCVLFAERVNLEAVAEQAGTPTYVYSRHMLVDQLSQLRQAWADVRPSIRYAVKANSNLAVLRILVAEGTGFDVVSRGEIDRVLAAGGDAATIDFAGVGKRDDEIDHALATGIGTLNVESEPELVAIATRAKRHGVVAEVALRVNPDVDARTHRHITTGREHNKFGIEAARVPDVASGLLDHPHLRLTGLEIRLEPGRILIGNAGVLLTRVLYVKEAYERRFVICDAGMNDLARPSLYDAYHRIEPVSPRPGSAPSADIVGPICETADTFGRGRELPPVQRGDLLCIRSAGAYGFTLASQYNSRPRAAEVLVDGTRFGIVRERESTADLMHNEYTEARWL